MTNREAIRIVDMVLRGEINFGNALWKIKELTEEKSPQCFPTSEKEPLMKRE